MSSRALPCKSYEHNGMILIGFVSLYFKIITSPTPLKILLGYLLPWLKPYGAKPFPSLSLPNLSKMN